jgi:hypothetical protein
VQVAISFLRGPHPEEYAFGSPWVAENSLWLNVAYLRNKGRVWTIEKVERDSRPLLKLMSFQRTKQGKLSTVPTTTFYLDPAKGNVVVEFEGCDQSGNTCWHSEIWYSDLTGHGTWYPVKIFDDSPVQRGSTVTIEIDHVTINPPFTDQDFSIQSLGLPPGQKIVQFDIKGHRTEVTLPSH